ncbi:hypothetical protein BGZ60DRAFT_421182 [Tricladium varicosporioides]|nr:hypothetical protein BGZ60DRAFT_421182 [Hymenoscyphus varicosporioides]
MVYRGKLSKACSHCRRRRLLCDLNSYGCAQCRRAKLVCGGYKDTAALRVIDETLTVQARSGVVRPLKLPMSVGIPTRQRAKDLFYYNYVVGKSQPLDFLQPYYDKYPSAANSLLESIDAVSLACLNFQKRTVSVDREARQHYISALRLTRSALDDPNDARNDSTILSVMLLDMYEKIVNSGLDHGEAWATHINAALALVKLRGNNQFQDIAGLRILFRLSINAEINCSIGERPIPSQLRDLRRTLAVYIPKPINPKWRQNELMQEYIELRQRMKDDTISDLEVVRIIRDIDAKLLASTEDFGPHWHQKTVYVQHKSRHHFEAYHYAYETEESARMWNLVRLERILLNEAIWSHSQALSGRERDMTCQIINNMAREICTTVPQFIYGIALPITVMTAAVDGVSLDKVKKPKVELNIAQQLACYSLIYPLYIAARSPLVSQDIHDWIIGELSFMADFHAIEHAEKVVKILKEKGAGNILHVYKILGSYAFIC